MKIAITVPDDIGRYILNNPGVGRVYIEREFGLKQRQANIYAAIGTMISNSNEEDSEIEFEILDKCKVEENISPGKSGSVIVRGSTLKDLYSKEGVIKKAIEEAGIDQKEWRIEEISTKTWHTSMKLRIRASKDEYTDKPHQIVNWLVSIKLKPNHAKPIYEAFEQLISEVQPLSSPISLMHMPAVDKDVAAEIIPVDAHFLKFGWGKETMAGDMDLEIIKNQFIDSNESNLQKVSLFNPSCIKFIIGNDLMHSETVLAETPKGKHHLDVDGRFQKGVWACLTSLIHVIDKCVQIAPTEIIWVPGNHDYHASWWLCEVLKHRYMESKHIEIDNGPSPKKCRLWGELLVGWVHDASAGKENRAINMLPQFWPKEWGKSRYRELHTGHKHKAEVTKFKPVYTVGGSIIRQCAGLTTCDFWHIEQFWTDAVPACESYLWHKEKGISAFFPTNIDYLKG